MNDSLAFLIRHGPLVLFIGVFIEQVGLPLPAAPLLLAAGALVAAGQMNWAMAIISVSAASLLADLVWYQLGRVRGAGILGFLCRISLEPDSCIRSTQDIFLHHGMGAVVAAKFIPGLSTVMPPLAAIFRVPLRRFLLFDGLGCVLYPVCVGGLGYLFSNQVVGILHVLGRIGQGGLMLILGSIAAYVGYKYFQRQRLLRRLRIARITVDELRRKQEKGDPLLVVDLRSELDLKNDPFVIAGALHFHLHDLERRHSEIPRDRDVVLYCSCPNEVTSARTAWLLQKRGIERVRPLAGGIAAWRERKYPLEPYAELHQETGIAPGDAQAALLEHHDVVRQVTGGGGFFGRNARLTGEKVASSHRFRAARNVHGFKLHGGGSPLFPNSNHFWQNSQHKS